MDSRLPRDAVVQRSWDFFLEVFRQTGKECSVNTTCALNDNDNRAGIVYLLLPSRFVPLSHVSNSKNFFRTN